MLDIGYKVYDKNQEKSIQDNLYEFSEYRVGKITHVLTSDEPTKIPFDIKYPLLDINSYNVFLGEISKTVHFFELPNHIKKLVYKAEKINFLNSKFLDYLKNKKMSENEFGNKNPKTRMDIFFDFLFNNQLDEGILKF